MVVPPYFSGDFFPAIKRMKEANLCPPGLNLKSIYKFLMEEITTLEENNEKITKPLRAEETFSLNLWNEIRVKVRQRGLDPELASFLFKLLHGILPTAARVSRILPNSSSICVRCRGQRGGGLGTRPGAWCTARQMRMWDTVYSPWPHISPMEMSDLQTQMDGNS